MNWLDDLAVLALTAALAYLAGRLHQSRERHLRRKDHLREAYAHWAAGMDGWHDSLVKCMRASSRGSLLHERLEAFEAQLDEARNRANLHARQLQVLESDDAFLNRVYSTTVALPHVGQEAWVRLSARAESGETVIVIGEYKAAMDDLMNELRRTRRLW